MRHSHCFLHCSVAPEPATTGRVTKRDWHRRAFERRDGLAQDVLTLLLLRWIAVAAVLLGIAALVSAEDMGASDLGFETRGAQRIAATDTEREERWR